MIEPLSSYCTRDAKSRQAIHWTGNPIVFTPPKLNNRCPTHPKIEKLLARMATGKNAEHIAGEVLLSYRDALQNDGSFYVSSTRLTEMYNARVRNDILRTINEFSTITTRGTVGVRTAQRKLNCGLLNRLKANENNGETWFDGETENVPEYMEHSYNYRHIRTLCNDWYQERQQKWAKVALGQPTWDLGYCTGDSQAGQCVLDSLSSIRLPTSLDLPDTTAASRDAAQHWHHKLISEGVPRCITRSYGRLYHPLLFGAKQIRRSATLRGEPVAEVDMHATYHCLLVAGMAASDEKRRLIDALQSGSFHKSFESAYARMRPRAPETNLKREIQRQLLFPRDRRLDRRPLMRECLRTYPAYGKYLDCLLKNKCKSPSALAKDLMAKEAGCFIDHLMLEIWDHGLRPVIPLHDGKLVRQSDAELVQAMMTDTLTGYLGFKPRVNVWRQLVVSSTTGNLLANNNI